MDARDITIGLRLHLGCGATTPPGWIHVDRALGARLARWGPLGALAGSLGLLSHGWPRDVVVHDLRRRLPWPDGAAEAIYSAFTLEYLTRRQGEYLLFECARVLAPGGVIRIVTPDLSAILGEYEKGSFGSTEFVERLGVLPERPGDGWLRQRLAPLLRRPRRCLYDAEGLLDTMYGVGLEARVHAPRLSRIEGIEALEPDELPEDSLIVEGVRASL